MAAAATVTGVAGVVSVAAVRSDVDAPAVGKGAVASFVADAARIVAFDVGKGVASVAAIVNGVMVTNT